MRLLTVASTLVLLAVPAWAQETKVITDHSGFEVTIPVEPLRIVSLHDWTATVMAYELGANLVGSTGRLDKTTNEYFVRSGRELYDLNFDDIEMASVHGQLDMEMISALDPDIIIGNTGDTLEYRDQLNLIAPTVMFDPMNGQPPMNNYADLAGWVNRTEKFDELKAAYDARIETAKTELLAGTTPSYVVMTPNPDDGDIRIFRNYGALSTVLEDLGFVHGSITEEVPEGEQEAYFSAEVISRLDTDWVFTHHIPNEGETETTMMEQLDAIAPGYRELLPSVASGQFVSLSRFHVYPTTFAAMDYVLDDLDRLIN